MLKMPSIIIGIIEFGIWVEKNLDIMDAIQLWRLFECAEVEIQSMALALIPSIQQGEDWEHSFGMERGIFPTESRLPNLENMDM